jgi:hypothetical protein
LLISKASTFCNAKFLSQRFADLVFQGVKKAQFFISNAITPKVLRGQILAFVGFGHIAVIRRCDMIFWEIYSR